MSTRRRFLQSAAAAIAAAPARGAQFESRRSPPLAGRKFTSEAVEAKIKQVKLRDSTAQVWLYLPLAPYGSMSIDHPR
jgi:hypothetical protein